MIAAPAAAELQAGGGVGQERLVGPGGVRRGRVLAAQDRGRVGRTVAAERGRALDLGVGDPSRGIALAASHLDGVDGHPHGVLHDPRRLPHDLDLGV